MKILDWCFATMFYATADNASKRSRIGRAQFLLWFSSSFMGGILFFDFNFIQNPHWKTSVFSMFISVFALNYFFLYRACIKMDRSKKVLETGKEITRSRVLFARAFMIISTFLSIAIMLAIAIYYGRNIGYL
jgi:hypothetical protein